MPIYEYHCKGCDTTVEVIRKITDPEVKPKCQNCFELGNPEMERILSAGTSFILKGGCWAKDGYRK